MNPGRIVLAGGSGFVGKGLMTEFLGAGHEVVVLSRSGSRESEVRFVAWDGKRVGAWAEELEGAAAIVNLAGRSVDCVWDEQNRREIRDSRVDATRAIGRALNACVDPPPVWINASAIGYYGDTGSHEVSEASPAGSGFLAETCREWEAAVDEFPSPVRKVRLRIGVVLGRGSGILEKLGRMTRLFLGGSAGRGTQFVSWIHLRDLLRLTEWAIETHNVAGPVNATAPNPVPNAVLMAELRRAMRRPWSPPAPALAVRIGAKLMGTEPTLALASQRVVPQIALAHDFPFEFPTLRAALADLV
ncbi:MAG TPA: TIGR01777 family oxidoreductase [Fimbriimonadaceae bacterium]|nr:TIGR01777 family oxidoreductase [Fimbriimonadaceae bacterium]